MNGTTSFDLAGYVALRRERVDAALDRYLPPEDTAPETLHRAMRYSVFSGGKRFRPVLCMAAFEACGGEGDGVLPVACAVELIHTYSLIHDDLPCMDDDDMRRGRATNHKVYGEAVAILAGDALLTRALELIVGEGAGEIGTEAAIRVSRDITGAVGSTGMVAGQVMDMEWENKTAGEDIVESIHRRKTGKLITSSVRCGAIAAGAGNDLLRKLAEYGSNVGLAFQIMDDILDEEGGFGGLKSGKGLDSEKGKATYPRVVGIEESKAAVARLIGAAKSSIAGLGRNSEPLQALADFVGSRNS
jgi:geranylgeranyl diphosphate synthase type II